MQQRATAMAGRNSFDESAARERCRRYRRRILEISQQVTALHVAPAFSCVEITDAIFHDLMRRQPDGNFSDSTFGEILKARDPRVMQFAIKFLF